MGILKNRVNYVSPQAEIIEFQADINFLASGGASKSFSSTFSFGDSGLGDGGEI